MTMPPPVVCLTCPAASPVTRKFSDQHLSTGPDTRTDPDFVASTEDFGQYSLTRSSSSFLTFPFRQASPTLALWSPVGMLHAKNPGARWFPKKSSTIAPCCLVSVSSYCNPGRSWDQSGVRSPACPGSRLPAPLASMTTSPLYRGPSWTRSPTPLLG